MKPVAIIQVRMSSTRLPGKVLKKLNGITVLESLLNQLNYSKLLNDKIIATTSNSEDDVIFNFCKSKEIKCYRGSQDDVLDRYYNCAKKFSINTIIRITSDCPLMDPHVVDAVINFYNDGKYDYVNNFYKKSYPSGTEVEVFSFATLEKTWKNASKPSEREHVTSYIYNNPDKFTIGCLKYKNNISHFHWTVDRKEDLELVRVLFSKISKKPILLEDILEVLKTDPSIIEINKMTDPDEGYLKSIENEKKPRNEVD